MDIVVITYDYAFEQASGIKCTQLKILVSKYEQYIFFDLKFCKIIKILFV